MDNKLDKLMGIVIGLCLIACGLLFVIRDYFTLPFGSIICMMIGFVCVVYYLTGKGMGIGSRYVFVLLGCY